MKVSPYQTLIVSYKTNHVYLGVLGLVNVQCQNNYSQRVQNPDARVLHYSLHWWHFAPCASHCLETGMYVPAWLTRGGDCTLAFYPITMPMPPDVGNSATPLHVWSMANAALCVCTMYIGDHCTALFPYFLYHPYIHCCFREITVYT